MKTWHPPFPMDAPSDWESIIPYGWWALRPKYDLYRFISWVLTIFDLNSRKTLIIMVILASNAAFATPLGSPCNLLVVDAGDYELRYLAVEVFSVLARFKISTELCRFKHQY